MTRRFCRSVILAASLLLPGHAGVANATEPSLAPLNPAFIAYQAGQQASPARLLAATDETVHPTGLLPSPIDYSYLKGQRIAAATAAVAEYVPVRLSLPQQYDLRILNKLTPVRNQGSCGSCWAFSAMGSMESMLKPGEARDFSENNLKNTHGFDWGHCSGGNDDMALAYFARRDGPVNESDDPYNASSNVSPSGLTPQKILTQGVIIPPRIDYLDNDVIKQAVIDFGAVQSSMYADGGISSSATSAYYKPSTYAYYYNGGTSTNHGINIVGWDDNFDRNNFSTVPTGNGAFLIRNSWGANWGMSGYFWLSYYDTAIGDSNYQMRGQEPVTKYATIYQYDPLGKTGVFSPNGTTTGWFANIFTATGSENITSAGFHVASANSTYDWYVYTGVTNGPRTGTLAASGTGLTLAAPGYQVVPLTPVGVTPGQKFSVVIKLTTPNYTYPVPVERPIAGYSSLATATAGQSYYSSNGSSWSDMTTKYTNGNVCLKALSQYQIAASIVGGNGSFVTPVPVYTGAGGRATIDLAPDAGYRVSALVTGSCPAGSFSGNSYTTGSISGNCTVSFAFVPDSAHALTLVIAGGVGGSIAVTPSPPGATCPGSCTQSFSEGAVITLTPTPAAGATFSNWGGDCSGSAGCQLAMAGDKSVIANFVWQQNVKNSATGTVYGLISTVYSLLAGGETVLVRGIDLTENLTFARPVAFTLKGGYDSVFITAPASTTIHGSLTIADGSVTVENIILAP